MISLLTWRAFAIVAFIFFIASIVVLIVTKLLKNNFYYDYREDELIKETKSMNSNNSLYFTSDPSTYQYIKKYVLCKTVSDKYCICQYDREFNKIVFFIIQYSKNNKIVAITKCSEIKNNEASRVIPLNRKTDKINIIISKVDKMEINSSVIKPLNKVKVLLYCLLKFDYSFTGLFVLRHIIVECLGQSFTASYFNSIYNLISILSCLLFGLVVSIASYISLKKRNLIMHRGGVIEYEFI